MNIFRYLGVSNANRWFLARDAPCLDIPMRSRSGLRQVEASRTVSRLRLSLTVSTSPGDIAGEANRNLVGKEESRRQKAQRAGRDL